MAYPEGFGQITNEKGEDVTGDFSAATLKGAGLGAISDAELKMFKKYMKTKAKKKIIKKKKNIWQRTGSKIAQASMAMSNTAPFKAAENIGKGAADYVKSRRGTSDGYMVKREDK